MATPYTMSVPVMLSDSLARDARLEGDAMERSIAGQVEFWARLGQAIDPILNGAQAMAISQRGTVRSLSAVLGEVEAPAGRLRLAEHVSGLPFPHYEPHPEQPGAIIRTSTDGTQVVGRFVHRVFTPM